MYRYVLLLVRESAFSYIPVHTDHVSTGMYWYVLSCNYTVQGGTRLYKEEQEETKQYKNGIWRYRQKQAGKSRYKKLHMVVQEGTRWYKTVQETVPGGTRRYKNSSEKYIQGHTGTYWDVLILIDQPDYAFLLDSLLAGAQGRKGRGKQKNCAPCGGVGCSKKVGGAPLS